MKGSRVKLFAVGESAILGVFGMSVCIGAGQEGTWTVPAVPWWPQGASFCPGVAYDWLTQTFRFRVQHESFPLVEEGKEPEIIRVDVVDKVVQLRVIPSPPTVPPILPTLSVAGDSRDMKSPISACVIE